MLIPTVLLSAFLLYYAESHQVLDLSSQKWTISNANKSIQIEGPVPGGVYSALEDHSIIDDILFGKNDINFRWVGSEDWTYYRAFDITQAQLNYTSIQLVLHGVDTVADVFINGQEVLSCNNMFLRYNVDIKRNLNVGKNNITVKFQSPINAAKQLAAKASYVVPPKCPPPAYKGECHVNLLRKMQASFSWDWGPAMPSSGIWKPVEIVFSEGPVIRSVMVKTTPKNQNWRVDVTVWFDKTNLKLQDTLLVELSDPQSGVILTSRKKFNLNKTTGENEVKLTFNIAKSKVKMWWPNGYGDQALYYLRVSYPLSEKQIQIGFRTIELIQENVTSDEKQGKTFYFLVNGVKIFAKGTNWIPGHILPEKLSDQDRIVPLLEAAAVTHNNMIRVWGGGVYESDMFYEICDRLGILVWQDLMFACSMYPTDSKFLHNVKAEIRQQIQRLQHHPSIAIWAGNNENEGALVDNWYGTQENFTLYKSDYIKLYVDTIMPIVQKLDSSREYITSSPSNGVETIREGYVSKKPGNTLYGDVHYYNYVGDGWDYRIFPNPRFASEYGFQSFPTVTCLRSSLPLGEFSWISSSIEHRQHSPGGNQIILNQISTNLPKPKALVDVVYLSQINQAMATKIETERYRRLKSVLLDSGEGYTSGALYWQLNDVWQAPSWASIDYCGHWKMAHYYAADFFHPIIVSPELSGDGTSLSLYVVIDGKSQYSQATATLKLYKFSNETFNPAKVISTEANMVDNESFVVLQLPLSSLLDGGKKEDHFITASLSANGKTIAPENFLFLSSLNISQFPETSVRISGYKRKNDRLYELTLTADKIALFVWLDLNGLDGIFSRNGFHLLQPSTKIMFMSKNPVDNDSIKKITVTWLKQKY